MRILSTQGEAGRGRVMCIPDVRDLSEYRAIYHRDELWRPAVDEILSRHGLLKGYRVRGPDGTHIVYFAGPSHVVKLFVPLFKQDFVAERLVAPRVEGRLGVATPAIVAEGELDGWGYLVMTRLPGRPLGEVWARMPESARREVATSVGEIIARLRCLTVDGLDQLAVDWKTFLETQRDTAAARHECGGLRWNPTDEIPLYLESTPEVFAESFEPVLLLADITDEHVLVSERGGSWSVSGYVDFGDAMVGHPDYELVAPGLVIARGDRDILRTLLLAAGHREPSWKEPLRRRLMAYTLMHRYVRLEDVLAAIPGARDARDIEELARLLWPVC